MDELNDKDIKNKELLYEIIDRYGYINSIIETYESEKIDEAIRIIYWDFSTQKELERIRTKELLTNKLIKEYNEYKQEVINIIIKLKDLNININIDYINRLINNIHDYIDLINNNYLCDEHFKSIQRRKNQIIKMYKEYIKMIKTMP